MFKPMMPSVYNLNSHISIYQKIVLTIQIAETQAISFILLYLPNTSVYKESFICSHVSVIFEEQFSLFSLQVMEVTFTKMQNFLKNSTEMNPKLSYSSADKYIKRQVSPKSFKPGKSISQLTHACKKVSPRQPESPWDGWWRVFREQLPGRAQPWLFAKAGLASPCFLLKTARAISGTEPQ